MLSVLCTGKRPHYVTSLSPNWRRLQSRWVSGYQPGTEGGLGPGLHWGSGFSKGTEPWVLGVPQGLVLPCPCPSKAVTSPEPGLGTARSCLTASKAENVALISLIGALRAGCIWRSSKLVQVPVPQLGLAAWGEAYACQAGVCRGPLSTFFPLLDIYWAPSVCQAQSALGPNSWCSSLSSTSQSSWGEGGLLSSHPLC